MRIHETADAFNNPKEIIAQFIDYWTKHSADPNGNVKPLEADNIINEPEFSSQVYVNTEGAINSTYTITLHDPVAKKLPFKFGKVRGMRLIMPNLETLEGSPRSVDQHFSVEQNTKLTSLVGCPKRADNMAFELKQPLESLACSNRSHIESIWIHAPEIKSFAGFTGTCGELTVNLPNQTSLTGIHKQLKGVQNLVLALPPSFSGGLLSVAMIPGLLSVTGIGAGFTFKVPGVDHALGVINSGIKQKMNVHEIQEELIEAGLRQFARL